MAKIKILHASVNPEKYNLKKIGKMKFEEALAFFESDTVDCCTWGVIDIDPEESCEYAFHADGAIFGDGSDTMFNWCIVL